MSSWGRKGFTLCLSAVLTQSQPRSIMDKLFGQFSLQNILRQMFCGVVFLLPFFIFPSITQLCPCVPKFYALFPQPSDFDFAQLTYLAVLSIIIGTLIYHLEKNLWSYGLQVIFCSRWCVRICFLTIAASAPISGIVISFLDENENVVLYLIPSIIGILAVIVSSFCVCCDEARTTDDIWLAEAGKKRLDKNATPDRRSAQIIMGKVSTWSDFIHCGQSCAWAWIIGSTLAYFILHRHAALVVPYRAGIIAAVCLLIAEAFIDWHRWQHVKNVLGEKDTAKESTINSALSSCLPDACKRCIRSSKTGRCILWRIVACRIKKRFNKIREWFSRTFRRKGRNEKNNSKSKKR